MFNTLNILGVSVGFTSRLPISVNKAIADIREPAKRNADFSKTITVPATREINILFEFAYDANILFQTFDPNKKTPASYFTGSTENIRGNAQLLAIVVRGDQAYYELAIRGTNADLFLAMGDSLLTDLDFSDLNHSLSYASFSATPTYGVGYYYGYIDYGLAGMNGYNWNVLHMKAAIFILEYIDRIFAYIGKTYTSTLFASADFTRLAMPCNKEGMYQLNASQVANKQFYAKKTTAPNIRNGSSVNGRPSPFPPGYQYYDFVSVTPVIFDDDSTLPLNDPGALYNTGTGQYITTSVSQSKISFTVIYDVRLSIPSGILASALTFSGKTNLQIALRRNGIIVVQSGINNNLDLTRSGTDMIGTLNVTVNYNTGTDTIGTIYDCVILPQSGTESFGGGSVLNFSMFNGNFFNFLGVAVTGGLPPFPAATYTVTGGTFSSVLNNQNLNFGDTIDMNTVVPIDTKIQDFFNWILKKFNIYIEQDKNNPNNYIIENRDDFFLLSGAPLNLDDKHDTFKEHRVIPMGELDAKSYLITDKADNDYYNKLYQAKYKEVYGQQLTIIDNDFIQQQKKIETGFSPTPCVAFQTDIVAPRLLDIEGSFPGGTYLVKPIKTNPRILYCGGLKPCQLHNLTGASGTVALSYYPSINHVDDAINPTIDLNFSAPRDIFWNLPGQMWTTNTQYNSKYKKFITEISDPNSKIVQMYAMLNNVDIEAFTFRRLVFWKGSLFYVNRLVNDDTGGGGSTMLELLKLKPAVANIGIVYNPYQPPTGQNRTMLINAEFNNAGNYGNASNANFGRDLVNGSDTGILVGHGVNVENGLKEFSAIGLKDKVIGSEYEGMVMLRDEGLIVSDYGLELNKLSRGAYIADFDVTKPISYVDASGGNIKATLPPIDYKGTLKIVRIDNSGNTLTVVGFSGENLKTNGASAVSYLQPTQTTKEFNSDLTAWYF